MKIIESSPVVITSNMENITTAIEKVYTKWIATVAKSDRAVNIVRSLLRVCHRLKTCPDLVDSPSTVFDTFFNSKIEANADGKKYYDELAQEKSGGNVF